MNIEKLEKEILSLIKSGRENEGLEIKEDFDLHEKIIKEMVAFANSKGGRVLIGWVEKNDGFDLKGINKNALSMLDEAIINDKIGKYLGRRIKFKLSIIKNFASTKKTVGIIDVFPNNYYLSVFEKDFTIKKDGKDTLLFGRGDIYVKHGSKTEKIRQSDIDEFLLRIKETNFTDFRELIKLDESELIGLFKFSSKEVKENILENLFKMLVSFKEGWRYKAAGVLGKVLNGKNKNTANKLINVYNTTDIKAIKTKVLYILREANFENINEFLIGELKNKDPDLSGLIIAAISKTGYKVILKDLLKFIGELDLKALETPLANRIIVALDTIESEKSIPYLIEFINHHNLYISGNACRILIRVSKKNNINAKHKEYFNILNDFIIKNQKIFFNEIKKNRKLKILEVYNYNIHIVRIENNSIDLLLEIPCSIERKIFVKRRRKIFSKRTKYIDDINIAYYIKINYIENKLKFIYKKFVEIFDISSLV